MTDIKVHIDGLDVKAPLFYKYQTQTNPQPARIELDPRDRSVRASINYSIGNNSDSADIWMNRIIIVGVSGNVHGPALIDFLNRKDFLELVAQVFDGHTTDCDGRGHLTEKAIDAMGKIEIIADNIDTVAVWDCEEWLDSSTIHRDKDNKQCDPDDAVIVDIEGIGIVNADSDPAKMAEAVMDNICDAYVVVRNIERYFVELIANLQGNVE